LRKIEVQNHSAYAFLRRGFRSHHTTHTRDSSLDGANDFSFDVSRQGTGISDSDADRRAAQARVDAALEPSECARSDSRYRENSCDREGWTVSDSVEKAHGIPGVERRSDLHQHMLRGRIAPASTRSVKARVKRNRSNDLRVLLRAKWQVFLAAGGSSMTDREASWRRP
jgi:hypothetical protein